MERDNATKGAQPRKKKKFQALILLVYKYNTPSLIRSQEGSVSNVGCMPQFHIFLIFNSFEWMHITEVVVFLPICNCR